MEDNRRGAQSLALATILMVLAIRMIPTVLAQAPGNTAERGGSGDRAAQNAARGALSIRWENWSAMRSAAGPILGWNVGIAATSFPQLSFSEAVAKADELGVAYLLGSSTQQVSVGIPKRVDYNLAPGEIDAVKERLNAFNIRMSAYRVADIGPDEASSRRLFAFAKEIGVETIVSERIPATLPLVDRLAAEYGVSVAINGDPKSILAVIEGRSERIGAYADIGFWLQEGVKPVDGLAQLKSRLLILHLEDRSTLGRGSKAVAVGTGAAAVSDFIREMYRMGVKPRLITVGAGDPAADITRSFAGLEKALQPVMADRVGELSRTTPIRTPDRLTPEERAAIVAALPKTAPAKPKKARKLLVLDLNVAYPGHRSIPQENLGIELMGKMTGAYQAVFSNDLDNLKYPKIKQFDAVFLSNTVGMLFVDPEVREGLIRFVREGGGLAGNHGVSHAAMDWPEFSEMIGARRGVHRENTEQATIRIEDPASPLTAAFGGQEFVYQDELFRFPNPPYSRDKLHVLLTIDVAKTDMNQGRPCASPCVRPDQDYAVSWIRSYGNGRVFFCILGHNPTIFTTPKVAQFFLAGIQFILGDLEADTTPSSRLAGVGGRR
jgi:type 1 glutamine amidotransferase/sugar phosphate isomerase/epimerase